MHPPKIIIRTFRYPNIGNNGPPAIMLKKNIKGAGTKIHSKQSIQ